MSVEAKKHDPHMVQLPGGVSDEDLLLAILSTVKEKFTELGLMKALARAAHEYGGMFLWCELHPQHHINQRVSEIRSTLVLGTSIYWIGCDLKALKCSEHTLGLYGRRTLDQFTQYQKQILQTVSEWVVELSKDE